MRLLQLATMSLSFALAGVAHADEQAEAKAILDHAIKAVGGADKAAKLESVFLKAKAEVTEGGQTVSTSFDMSVHAYDRVRMEMTITAGGMANNITFVFVGDKGWARNPDNKVEEAPKEVVPLMQQFLLTLRSASHPAALATQKDFKLAAGGVGKVGDVEANILRISRKDFADITLYYDKKTGLPLKSETRIKEPGGEEKDFEFHFSQFKDVNGVKVYSRVKLVRDGKDLTEIELSDFKVGEKFDANTFEKP